jgi:hypothetical protein
MKKTLWSIVSILLIVGSASLALGGQGPSGSPWFPTQQYFGKTEYNGKLYVLFQDTNKNQIAGGIGNPAGEGYREYVVEIQFILELVEAKGKTEPLYFTGIGKTCEDCLDPMLFPDCDPGEEGYYDAFYLPGDYVGRIGAALHSFLQEEVYPVLCNEEPGCQGFLTEAIYNEGFGNAEAVVNSNVEIPSQPWYWIQPITIVTP